MAVTEEMSVNTASGMESPLLDAGEVKKKPFKSQIVWFNCIGFLIMHLFALYGVYLMVIGSALWPTIAWAIFISYFAGVCITLGAHRLWTHRSYKAKLPLKLLLLVGQTIAGQNCLWVWVRDHRQHHKYSDTDADPHNSSRGFWFSHIGWLMMKKHPDVIAKGKLIDMSDIEADPYIMFQKKYYKSLYLIFAILIPGFVPYFCWGESLENCLFISYFARYLFGVNVTWCVNSVAHLWGTRPYSKEIAPVENTLVSFFGAGEGWHNYHHCFPWDCNASEFGKHFNTTSQVLHFFERIGLAYDLRYASTSMVQQRILKHGDGTHPLH